MPIHENRLTRNCVGCVYIQCREIASYNTFSRAWLFLQHFDVRVYAFYYTRRHRTAEHRREPTACTRQASGAVPKRQGPTAQHSTRAPRNARRRIRRRGAARRPRHPGAATPPPQASNSAAKGRRDTWSSFEANNAIWMGNGVGGLLGRWGNCV